MVTVILASGQRFDAEWAAEAFENRWAAKIIDSNIIDIVTAFAGNEGITVQEDGLADRHYYGYQYVDSIKVYSNGDITITMRKEA